MSSIIKRGIFPLLVTSLESDEITVLLGPRQVGKTTLLKELQKYLTQQRITDNRIFYFNFDDVNLRSQQKRDYLHLQKTIEKILGQGISSLNDKIYIFIDEAQKTPSVFDWVKIIFDNHFNVKIMLSGSSSLRIRDKTAELLTGRAEYFYLSPLTLSEIFNRDFFLYPEIENYQDLNYLREKAAYYYKQEEETERVVNKLSLFGGLPKIYLAEEKDAILRLSNFSQIYLDKEIKDIGSRVSLENLHFTFKGLAGYSGLLLNLAKLSVDLGIARPALYTYLAILEKTMVISFLAPLLSSDIKSITKSRKMHLFDTGIINNLLGLVSVDELLRTKFLGQIFETLIFNQFKSKALNSAIHPDLRYWRDFEDHEIDIIYLRGEKTIPIEVTQSRVIATDKIRNFRAFFKTHPEANFGLLVYRGELQEIKIIDKKILAIPYFLT